MSKSAALVGGAMVGAAVLGASSQAFTVASSASTSAGTMTEQRFLRGSTPAAAGASSMTTGAGVTVAAAGLAAAAASRRSRRSSGMSSSTVVALQPQYFRDSLIACRAQYQEAGAPSVEETDDLMAKLAAHGREVLAGSAAALVMSSSIPAAEAYPIFAQQNYANPREYSGKIVCANCHLAKKDIETHVPNQVLPDTIFKTEIIAPLKYDKRVQPVADGSKAKLNVGAVAVFPEGWKLAPKDRLPKVLKKQMKGLAWAPYSKEYPNIVVAGPVPGENYEKMVLPMLAPDPAKNDKVEYGKSLVFVGANRGRGQVYPEGNISNNNQFFAPAAGTVSAIDGMKITYDTKDGPVTQDLLPGADIVVKVGEEVVKDEPVSTNPNVGGFGQAEKEIILQDMNRVYFFCAFSFSIFVSQVAFVLKKKQFEKVQLAEGF